MSLFTDPPSPGDRLHHQLTETAIEAPFGGSSYTYRGAVIDCLKGGQVYRLTLDGHPLTGSTRPIRRTLDRPS